uniref:Outer capsid protein VP2 n=1 Tax=Bluetongue virus TaxID=40051 RepID=A0A2H4KLT2_BTV|nr:VP2 [Bluetongue virus]
MDELGIPIYKRGFPEHLLHGYEFTIDSSTKIQSVGGRHDVTKLPEMNAYDIKSENMRTALWYNPVRNDGFVLPRVLDITLRGYDGRRAVIDSSKHKSFHTDERWVQWMMKDSMDAQPLKVGLDDRTQKIAHSLHNCVVKIDSKKADTMSYHIEPIEDSLKGCLHTRTMLWNHLVRVEMSHAAQEIAYTLKPTYDIVVHAERRDRSQPFQPGDQTLINFGRGQKVQMNHNSYEKMVEGLAHLVIRGKTPELIRDEITKLDEICNRWIHSRHDPGEIKAYELCKVLSTVGRKMLDQEKEPADEADLSIRFQEAIDNKFRRHDSERLKIFEHRNQRRDEDRFYILLMIAASDTFNTRVWWSNPYPCLRGTLIASETKLGDVYSMMRSWYDWSVRPTYTPYERSREQEKYIYGRVNLFDYVAEPGTRIIHWEYKLNQQTKDITYEQGNPCDLFPDDDEAIVTKFDDVAYGQMVSDLINGGWDQERFKMHKILKPQGNVLTIDFEKDAKLTSNEGVVMPEYFDKWIIAPMFNAKLRIKHGELAERRNDDPMVKRTLSPIAFDPIVLQRLTLARFYDIRPAIMGQALSRQQEQSTYDEKISKIEGYAEILQRRGIVQIPKKPCPTVTAQYTLERYALFLINILEQHIIQSTDEDVMYSHPRVDYKLEVHGESIIDISQIVVFVFDFLFERRRTVRGVYESRYMVTRIRDAQGQNRINVITEFFPTFGYHLSRIKEATIIQEIMYLNFLPLFFLVSDNIIYTHKQWSIPLFLYAHELKVIPLEVGSYNDRCSLVSYIEYMVFFPSKAFRTSKLDEVQPKIAREVLKYYINTKIFEGGVNLNVVTTKQLLYETYLASICGGLSDGIVWYLPITHPNKCIVAIEVSDERVPASIRASHIKFRFPLSVKHLKGIVIIQVDEEGKFTVYSEGIVSHRVCKKNLLKYMCDIVLLKFSGHVFGNDEMLTKLLNV